jgi:hypothetical protein
VRGWPKTGLGYLFPVFGLSYIVAKELGKIGRLWAEHRGAPDAHNPD